jgi:hypothetical protein
MIIEILDKGPYCSVDITSFLRGVTCKDIIPLYFDNNTTSIKGKLIKRPREISVNYQAFLLDGYKIIIIVPKANFKYNNNEDKPK